MRALLLVIALVAALPTIAQQQDAAENARRTVASIETLLKVGPEEPTRWF